MNCRDCANFIRNPWGNDFCHIPMGIDEMTGEVITHKYLAVRAENADHLCGPDRKAFRKKDVPAK